MKRSLTQSVCFLLLTAFSGMAAPFTPGNIAVERIGAGTSTLTSAGTPVFIDEYTPGGVWVQSIAVPSTGASAVVNSGVATSEGQMTLSADRHQLVIAGYNTNAGFSSIAGSTNTMVPRVVGTVDSDGNFTLGPAAVTNFNKNNIRSAASDGKGNFWAAGANSGTLYLTNGAAPVVIEESQPSSGNTRVNEIFGGNLYYSSGSAEGVFFLGALPTAATAPIKVVTDTGSPYDFAVSPDTNTIYVADDNSFGAGGVLKYTNGPGGYALDYILTNGLGGPGTRSLAVDFTGGAPVIYAVATNNTLVKAVDTGTNTVFTAIVTAATDTAIRAVKFAPVAPAVNGQPLVLGSLAVVRIGGQGESLTSNGHSVHIDEFSPQGSLVNTIDLPNTGSDAFVLDNNTVEGYLSLNAPNSALVLAGYNVPVGSTQPGFATAAAAPRAVATIDGYGDFALPITNNLIYSTWEITSAVSDGSNFWSCGASSSAATDPYRGVIYLGTADAPVTVPIANSGGREEAVELFNDTLFVDSSFSPNGIFQILNTNTPVTNLPEKTNSVATVIALPSATRNVDYAFDSGMTTCYYADSRSGVGGVVKFTNSAGGWVSNYTIPGSTAGFSQTGCLGLTVDWSQRPVVIYATTSETAGNRLIKIIDTGSGAVAGTLAQAFTNATDTTNVFRGVRFTPGQAPMITTAPVADSIISGANATFTVAASGTPVLGYQWYSNNVAVPGAATSSITFSNVTVDANGALIFVTIDNGFGSVSSVPVALDVAASRQPTIELMSPSNLVVNAGQSASFTITAINASNYFWFHGATPLSDTGEFTNTGTATLTISPAFALDDGSYSVIVSNQYGTATSGVVTLSVNDPYIVTAPVGFTNFPGFGTNFEVVAVGSAPLTYQWLSNGVAISGANATNLFVTSATSAETTYSVVVSNSLGMAVTSVVAIADFNPYLIWDDFNYSNGNIVATSDGVWERHSGSGNDSFATNTEMTNIFDQFGSNGVYVVNQYRQDDVDRAFTIPQPESEGITVYASFTVDMQTLPANAGGTYFAHFCDTNKTSGFWGRLFALTTNAQAPGTYRLGVANTQGDYNANSSTPTGPYEIVNTAAQPPEIVASAIYPLDLATNIPYQVVVGFDIDDRVTKLWINPVSETDSNVVALDQPITTDGFPLSYFDFRQTGGEGISYVDDLRVATNFSDVITNNPALPIIGLQPQGITNYAGNDLSLEVCASGKGLTYQWYKDGSAILDAATNGYPLANRSGADSGNYWCVLSTAAGSVTTAVATVFIDDTMTVPFFTTEPQNTTNYVGAGATFTAAAVGTGPLTYAWYFNDGTNTIGLGNNGITVITYPNEPVLNLKHLNQSEAGTYYVTATGPAGTGTSSNALLVINSPPITPIATLRHTINADPNNSTTTTGTALFAIQGTIILQTNITTGNTASYYVQDSTGGIDLFVTGDSTFRPPLGAEVTAIGTLDVYQNELELEVDATLPNEPYFVNVYTNGSNVINNLPAPQVLPLDYLAGSANQLSLISNVDGSLIMLTNVYFANGGQLFSSNGSHDYLVTNGQGSVDLFADSIVATNFAGLEVPTNAFSIMAPLAKYQGGWEIQLASPSQIITSAPPATTLSAHVSGGATTITWPALPYNPYTVLSAPVIPGAFSAVGGNAISSAVVFTNGAGSFVSPNTSSNQFYEVVSP